MVTKSITKCWLGVCTIGLTISALTACGAHGGAGGGAGAASKVDSRPLNQSLVGTWVGPCNTATSQKEVVDFSTDGTYGSYDLSYPSPGCAGDATSNEEMARGNYRYKYTVVSGGSNSSGVIEGQALLSDDQLEVNEMKVGQFEVKVKGDTLALTCKSSRDKTGSTTTRDNVDLCSHVRVVYNRSTTAPAVAARSKAQDELRTGARWQSAPADTILPVN